MGSGSGTGNRPTRRADCLPGGMNEMRPCPYVGCKYHLFSERAMKIDRGTSEIEIEREVEILLAMEETCSLDIAQHGGILQGEIAKHLGLEEDAVRKIEKRALPKLRSTELKVFSEED